MSIKSEITRIDAGVKTQASLISQIQTALQGKAAGDGGNSGGGETCTVTLSFTGGAAGYGESGSVSVLYTNTEGFVNLSVSQDNTTINDIMRGSIMILMTRDNYSMLGGVSTQNCELVYDLSLIGDSSEKSVFIPNASEATITIG